MGNVLDAFAENNYGVDFPLDSLECLLETFYGILTEQLEENESRLGLLEKECNTLLAMANRFSSKHSLSFTRRELTGCEADLNQLRSDLSAFFKELTKAGRQAKVDINALANASSSIGNTASRFISKYHPTCPADGQTSSTNEQRLKSDLKVFYAAIRRPYNAAHPNLVSFSTLCETLAAAIDSWNTKLA